ncbi:MFS transporter [Collimonas sp. NPDC087041]|uniref:MFS transporter n=1 Tax=Collimonas sp. NPDC087041 TaxID=3363960 RepID=UPI0037F6BB46
MKGVAMCSTSPATIVVAEAPALPLAALLALATAGFITILTEALPAGLLAQMSRDLAISEALIGQFVTIYAIGSLLAAIPLVALTRSWRRRPLLQTAICGFFIVNTITALADNYLLILLARLFAGIFAGLLWALLAGFAGRMVTDSLRGRAIAVAMVGAPLALSLGIPLGTLVGSWVGWRYTFGAVSLLTLVLVFWVQMKVPDFAGEPKSRRNTVVDVLAMPGVSAVLAVTFSFVLAHNILYTYIAPFLTQAGMAARTDLVLFVFGCMAMAGIWIVGVGIDRWLRRLTVLSIILFGIAALALAVWSRTPPIIYLSIGIWGLAFGGIATLFQTAAANASGTAADVGQALIVTVWNAAIAGGGAIGGVLLEMRGAASLPWVLVLLLALALLITWRASRHGFPARQLTTKSTPGVA